MHWWISCLDRILVCIAGIIYLTCHKFYFSCLIIVGGKRTEESSSSDEDNPQSENYIKVSNEYVVINDVMVSKSTTGANIAIGFFVADVTDILQLRIYIAKSYLWYIMYL